MTVTRPVQPVVAMPDWRIALFRYLGLDYTAPPHKRRPGTIITKDQQAIANALIVHTAMAEPPRILDTTFNKGRMWSGLPIKPTVRADGEPQVPGVDKVQWDDLASFYAGQKFDMIVWDPPHQSDAGHNQDETWADSYGTKSDSVRVLGQPNISHLYRPFFAQAEQLLAPEGVVLVKISDQAHGNARQWQLCMLWQAALSMGWLQCDMNIKVRPSARPDPKHKRVKHYGNQHSYFPVYRLGDKCESPDQPWFPVTENPRE